MATSRRQALLIGNDRYLTSPLESCVNDATAMSAKLMSIGFQVKPYTDCSLDAMHIVTENFTRSIKRGSIVLFYFSGHGSQSNGVNYLAPTDYGAMDRNNIAIGGFDAQTLLYQMHKKRPRAIICILDCCRNGAGTDPEALDRRGFFDRASQLGTGLAPMAVPSATIVAYACAAGTTSTAASRNKWNSLYTYHLLRFIKTPNVDIETILKLVAKNVQRDSVQVGEWNLQIPYRYSSCNENIYLVGSGSQLNAALMSDITRNFGVRKSPSKNSVQVNYFERYLGPSQAQPRKAHTMNNFQPWIHNLQYRFNDQRGMPSNYRSAHRKTKPSVMRPYFRYGFPFTRNPHHHWL